MTTIGTDMAFPVPGSENNYMAEGMTKREHFAAVSLQGLLAGCDYDGDAQESAALAVKSADALIAALNGQEA